VLAGGAGVRGDLAARRLRDALFLGWRIVLWKHRGNLERLLAGTEPRIGASKPG
jgi:glycerol-3-phosphate acyltransferase PlsY